MARWKALAEFLLSVIELLFLSLTVKALQGKMCQNSQPSGVGRSLWAKISGGRGRPGEYFLVSTKLDTFCYPMVQTAPCYVPSFWHNTGVWQTDRQRDGHRWNELKVIPLACSPRTWRAIFSPKILFCDVHRRRLHGMLHNAECCK